MLNKILEFLLGHRYRSEKTIEDGKIKSISNTCIFCGQTTLQKRGRYESE
jgi:hypothetical protein